VHILLYFVKCTVTDSPFGTEGSSSKCPPSAWTNFLSRVKKNLKPYEAFQRC